MSLPATGDLPAETLTYAYNDGTDGGLASLTSSLTTPTSTLFQQPTYTSQGLLSGWQSGVASGNPAWQASVSLSYDGDLRVTDAKLTRTDTISGLSLPIAEVQPSYDAAGNVSGVTTTLAAVGSTPGGSETQAFCYDDLDRLTWAGTSGTGPCGRAGSEGLAGAGYTASYAYDTFDRLTSASVLNGSGVALPNAAQGTYTYGASGHLHAVSSVGTGSTGYSAAYDAAGELTCRAVGASTCTNATPTGQALGYDALRRLIAWQDATTSPTATGAYAYDGGGTRVWQQDTSTSGGVTTTTTTTYILGVAEITSVQTGQAAPSTTATRFYPLPGGVSALRDAAGLSYVAGDHLGTPIATLNLDTGAVLGEQLRAPYGQARYAASAPTTGGMRTTYGFTGQREDATATGSSGLDDFNARYYDPVIGRFTSPDSLTGSDALLDGYAYVGGQVESATDPSGHVASTCMGGDCGGGGWGEPDWSELLGGDENVAASGAQAKGDDQGKGNDPNKDDENHNGKPTVVDPPPLEGEGPEAPGARGAPDGFRGAEIADEADAGAPGARGNPDGFEPPKGPTEPTEPSDPNPVTSTPPDAQPQPPAGQPTNAPSTTSTNPGASTTGSSAPSDTNFVVTPNGEAIQIPEGATGPTPVINQQGKTTGFGYTGGKGGLGMNRRVSTVRIMDPTEARGRSPGYPGGYATYENASGQKVNPITGRTIPDNDPDWGHVDIGLR